MAAQITRISDLVALVRSLLSDAGYKEHAHSEGAASPGKTFRVRVASLGEMDDPRRDSGYKANIVVFGWCPISAGSEEKAAVEAPEMAENIAAVLKTIQDTPTYGVSVEYQGSAIGKSASDYLIQAQFGMFYIYS